MTPEIPTILKEELGANSEVVRWSLWSTRRYHPIGQEERSFFTVGRGNTFPGFTNMDAPGMLPGGGAMCVTRLRAVPHGSALGWLPVGALQDVLGFSSVQFQIADKIVWEGPARVVYQAGVDLDPPAWIYPLRPFRVEQRWSHRIPLRAPAGWPIELCDLLLMMLLDGWLLRRAL